MTDAEAGTDGAGDAVLAARDGDGVLTLTFNRPERRNGWADDMYEAYHARLTPSTCRDGSRSR